MEKKQFEDKRALSDYISGELEAQALAYDAKLAALSPDQDAAGLETALMTDLSDDRIIECLTRDGYDLDDLTANGEAYKIGTHTNRPASRERIIKALLDLSGFVSYEEDGRLYALYPDDPTKEDVDVSDFTVRQLIDWLGY